MSLVCLLSLSFVFFPDPHWSVVALARTFRPSGRLWRLALGLLDHLLGDAGIGDLHPEHSAAAVRVAALAEPHVHRQPLVRGVTDADAVGAVDLHILGAVVGDDHDLVIDVQEILLANDDVAAICGFAGAKHEPTGVDVGAAKLARAVVDRAGRGGRGGFLLVAGRAVGRGGREGRLRGRCLLSGSSGGSESSSAASEQQSDQGD